MKNLISVKINNCGNEFSSTVLKLKLNMFRKHMRNKINHLDLGDHSSETEENDNSGKRNFTTIIEGIENILPKYNILAFLNLWRRLH